MILGFKPKRIEAFYNTGTTKGVRTAHAQKLKCILGVLEGAISPNDLSYASF